MTRSAQTIVRTCRGAPVPRPLRNKGKKAERSSGFTLIEVILALAILGGAVAVLGEVMRLANENAVDARAETQAELLALGVMDELATGYLDLATVRQQPLTAQADGPWLYSVSVGTSQIVGIVPVEVLVEQDLEPQFHPVRYRLTQWFADITPPATSDSSSSGGGTGGSASGGSSTGGSATGGADNFGAGGL